GNGMTFVVGGHGNLTLAGTLGSGQQASCLRTLNPSSRIDLRCSTLTNTVAGGTFSECVYTEVGTVFLEAERIVNTPGSGVGSTAAIWWTDGTLRVEAKEIVQTTPAGVGVSAAILSDNFVAAVGDLTITAQSITGTVAANTGSGGILNVTFNPEAKVWVEANLISFDNVACNVQGGKTYVTAQKLAGCTTSQGGTLGVIYANGDNVDADTQLWLTAQKVTATYERFILMTGGTVRATVPQFEDLGGVVEAVNVSGGALTLTGTEIVIQSGSGVVISGGTVRLVKCRIDTSANPSGFPVVVSGGTLILDGCTLVAAPGQDSIHAASPQTVTNYGSVATTAKNANVTVLVDALTVDANVQ
ncbi:MAG TPA: hypothetical protein VGF55_17315, partial [Gemmataceae bacterium]